AFCVPRGGTRPISRERESDAICAAGHNHGCRREYGPQCRRDTSMGANRCGERNRYQLCHCNLANLVFSSEAGSCCEATDTGIAASHDGVAFFLSPEFRFLSPMKVAFITTINHNVGDDFVRAGIMYLLSRVIAPFEPAFIHKHL